eukprot:238734-Prorocentrum_minimum.AAC.1
MDKQATTSPYTLGVRALPEVGEALDCMNDAFVCGFFGLFDNRYMPPLPPYRMVPSRLPGYIG